MRLAALTLALPLALAGLPDPTAALAQNLVANPTLVRDLPPPGWLADRRADWTAQHPVYQATCRTPEVGSEIEFLNRVVGRDEMLLNLAGHPPQGNSALAREAQLANRDMGTLRNDIVVADGLVAQLQALPACGAGTAASTGATAPAAVPPIATPPPAPPTAPAASKPPAPDPAGTVALRFDDKVIALTPRSIRAFDQAVEAIRAGKPVRLTIDGCTARTDFTMGSACGERLRSLEAMLKDNGVRDPKRLFPGAP